MDKKTADRDWLQTFQQVKRLRKEYNKTEQAANDYSLKELTDIQRRQLGSTS